MESRGSAWGRGRGRGRGGGAPSGGREAWRGRQSGQDEFRPTGPIRMAVRPPAGSNNGDAPSNVPEPIYRILQPVRPPGPCEPSPPVDPTPLQSLRIRPQSTSTSVTNGKPQPPVVKQQTVAGKVLLKKPAAAAMPTNPMRVAAIPQNIMDLSVRLVDDTNEFCDITQFLTENTGFTVIGIIGQQGTGKSTLLSMIAGNEPQDMYREYIFRPSSREAVESCLHQTSKISVYVGSDQTIYLDTQPCMSPSTLDEIIKQQRRGYMNQDISPELYHEQETHRLLAFLYQVCHTIILSVDWFLDINLVRELRNVELISSSPTHTERPSEMFRPKTNRKVNLVVIQQRSKVEDYQPLIIHHRSQLLEKLFSGSRLRVDGGLTLRKVMSQYVDENDPVKANYILFPDLKPRQREGFNFPSHNPQRRSPQQDELKNLRMGTVDYTDVLYGLRRSIKSLPKDSFGMNGMRITEKQWYAVACRIWQKLNDRSFNSRSHEVITKTGNNMIPSRFHFGLHVALICLLWYAVSSTSSIVNKITLQQYPYPTTVALASLISVSLYASFLINYWGISTAPISSHYLYRYIFPISFGKALAAGSAYYGLSKVPVSYAHTIKSTMPLFAVVMARIMLGEKQRVRVYLSLLPIVFGVTIASFTEISFNLAGLLSSLFSTFTYSVLNVVVKKILKETDMHPLRLLSINSQIAAIFLFPFWVVKDAFSIHYVISSGGPGAIDSHFLVCLMASGFLSFAQNLCAFTLIHKLTALSYAVTNATKRVTVIAASLVTLRNPVSNANLFGMFLSVLGVFLYNRAKQSESKRRVLPVLSDDKLFQELLPQEPFHQHLR